MTKADIFRRLYELEDRDVIMHAAVLYQHDKELCFEACEQYGSVRKAVEAADLRYPEIAADKLEFTLKEIDRLRALTVAK